MFWSSLSWQWKTSMGSPQNILFSRLNPSVVSSCLCWRSVPDEDLPGLLCSCTNISKPSLFLGCRAGSSAAGGVPQGQNDLSPPAAHTAWDAAQAALGLLGCEGTFPEHAQPLICGNPQLPLHHPIYNFLRQVSNKQSELKFTPKLFNVYAEPC